MTDFESQLAQASGQVLTETAADARRAVHGIFGDAALEIAAILSDSVKLWRFKNLMRIAEQVQEIARERGLSKDQLKALPLGDALRISAAAADEDQPEVQALWARLISGAMSGDSGVVDRAFVDLLRGMSPNEVLFLDLLWKAIQLRRNAEGTQEYWRGFEEATKASEAQAWSRLPDPTRQVVIQNLQRLRCIAPPPPRDEPFLIKTEMAGGEYGFSSIRTLDARKVESQLKALGRYLHEAVGGDMPRKRVMGMDQAPEWSMFVFTSLGDALMRACTAHHV